VFFPHVIRLMPLKRDRKHPDWTPAQTGIETYYEQIDRMLDNSEYLVVVGDYSFADIAFYIAQLFAEIMGVPLSPAQTHAIAWRDRMLAREPVSQVTAALASYVAAQSLPLISLRGVAHRRRAASSRSGKRPLTKRQTRTMGCSQLRSDFPAA
jgi:glutathione S-transferase